jgi:hypothetical protein
MTRAGARRSRSRKALDLLRPEESATVLRSILERHPELAAEAEELARAAVSEVDAEIVADDVKEAVSDLDLDDLGTRAGPQSWGYVEPTEAAWEILGEAVDPFVHDMKRQIALGFEAAAAATCAGIVLGLYRCRECSSDQLVGWAEDFAAEVACEAAATLARESRAQHRRAWRLTDTDIARVPDWADMLARAARTKRRSR